MQQVPVQLSRLGPQPRTLLDPVGGVVAEKDTTAVRVDPAALDDLGFGQRQPVLGAGRGVERVRRRTNRGSVPSRRATSFTSRRRCCAPPRGAAARRLAALPAAGLSPGRPPGRGRAAIGRTAPQISQADPSCRRVHAAVVRGSGIVQLAGHPCPWQPWKPLHVIGAAPGAAAHVAGFRTPRNAAEHESRLVHPVVAGAICRDNDDAEQYLLFWR